MKKIILVASFILLIGMTFACQTLRVQETGKPAGPAGAYLIKMSTPQGEMELTMTIKEDRTGYIESTMMGKSEFSDAMIEGNNFKFNATMNTPMGEMEMTFIGTVDGDNINGSIGTQMGDIPFAGQRI